MQIERAKGAAIKITDVLELIQFERLREGIARQACLREGMHVFESVACFVCDSVFGARGLIPSARARSQDPDHGIWNCGQRCEHACASMASEMKELPLPPRSTR